MKHLRSEQITNEQKLVLQALVEYAGKPGLKILEIGSWLGESTIFLGNLARKFGGTLTAVDWWKGNPGTSLEPLAAMRDIFSIFWKRICSENLDDVVIPLRAHSNHAHEILRPNTFDLIFIDADHRYGQVSQDLRNYVPLAKKDRAIICGHDCEGYIQDFDPEFLEQGKDQDYYQTVHCGVVLAVGQYFDDYSIHQSIWSATWDEPGKKWTRPDLNLPKNLAQRQSPPPPLAISENYRIFRQGRRLFALPSCFKDFTPYEETPEWIDQAIVKDNLNAIEQETGEAASLLTEYPIFIGSHYEYNLVYFQNNFLALHRSLGEVNLVKLSKSDIKPKLSQDKYLVSFSLEEIKKEIEFNIPKLIVQNYKNFNIVYFRGEYIALDVSLGELDITSMDTDLLCEESNCFKANSINQAKTRIDEIMENEKFVQKPKPVTDIEESI